MRDYYKVNIINTLFDIKKLIDYIITDNIIISIDKKTYIDCINDLYYILINTLNNIETLYYNKILLPKLNNVNYNNPNIYYNIVK